MSNLLVQNIKHTNGTSAMTIDSSGRVLTPVRPAFFARATSHVTASGIIVFDTATYNLGSHYNTSNGKFTCPVAGLYLFNFKCLFNTPDSDSHANLHINGSNYSGTQGAAFAYGNIGGSAGHYLHNGGSDVVSLSASDAVTIYYTDAGTDLHHSYTTFSGCLIG